MFDLRPNLTPGNPDGHTVLRYLVEARQMPLESAIDRVYQAVAKFAGEYRSDQNKLLGGMVITGVLGLPVFFPFGVSSLLIAGAVAASAFQWQELGTMRDRLKPEYQVLKGSVLLEQFIKWLAQELRERRSHFAESGQFQPDAIATANILAAYEDTVLAVTHGEHLENNASDPILALFVLKLRQHTNHLPPWVMDAFRQLEQAEVQRATDVERASRYMWGNLEQRYPEQFNQQPQQTSVGQNTRLGAVEVPGKPVQGEGEQRLGKLLPPTEDSVPKTKPLPPFDRDRIINESKGLMIIGDMGAAKTCVAQYIANGFLGYGIIVFDPHGKTDWGNAYVLTKMGAIYEQMKILLTILENGDESPLLVIADEWLEIRGDRRNKSGGYKGLADDFIRLFSTKPRKFNKLAGFVLHSPNVEAAGIDSFLRENYLKVYLGKLAKKEFPHIQDCAYPCVLEDEQQEHPTHGHYTVFRPKGNAPRNLQPLNSAAIDIPLAYMDGEEGRVHTGGWANGAFLQPTNIRERLELLFSSDTSIDTSIDTKSYPENSPQTGDTSDTSIDSGDTGTDTEDSNTPETIENTGGSNDTESDTADTSDTGNDTDLFTPARLPKEQILTLIKQMKTAGLSQTQIIQSLWSVEKNKTGWKQAYSEYKRLTGE